MRNSNIRELCIQYTDLTNYDILKIEDMVCSIQPLADVSNGNVFIDCPTRDKDVAIVVAEAKPLSGKSMYKNSVVGKLAYRDNEPAVLRTLELGIATKELKAVTQEMVNVRQNVAPIENNNRVIGALIIEKDVTGKINNDRYVEMLTEGYKTLTDTLMSITEGGNPITNNLDQAIIMFDENGIVRFKNPKADRLYSKLGYKDTLIGMDYNNISFDNSTFENVIKDISMENTSSGQSIQVQEVNVGNLFLELKRIFIPAKTIKLIIMIKDITSMKQKEKELILKSVAIKEIHHRVKNNLQTVASLLRLQARRSDNENTKESLNESMNRILSIAATHEILAKEGIDEVNIQDVISNIKNNSVKYFDGESKNIKVNLEGDDFKIDSDKATSIALVVNELLQNSMHYAFKNKDSGIINIIIKKGEIYSAINLIDNGIGFDIKNKRSNSLGLSIVQNLVKDKLNGDIDIVSNSKGTKIRFDFKN
ncbi:histidine kinase [Clostridium sp. P21]|uniref:histidine kinase n=1 Tax=Clostridium muellerianum TaxID=2716538 RepID=A0A7Y0EHZ2_9CLOT|nr:histidine kinase N-terminal domain-containing protein [Clostridium muellerianum]NMM63806.1 histidine kinase [Clostridium muellerianum]